MEDDQALRQVISAHLRREGFQVLEEGNGLDALSLLRRGAVDIALVDVVLPGIDGLEWCGESAANPRFRSSC